MDIVFDFDDTLVQAHDDKTAFETPPDAEFAMRSGERVYLWKRPHFDALFAWLLCDTSSAAIVRSVSIFSYGHEDYVVPAVALLLPPSEQRYRNIANLWTRKHCTARTVLRWYGADQVVTKNLGKFFRRKRLQRHRTLMIDDTDETMACNFGNGVLIPKYSDPDVQRMDDRALLDVRAAVEKLAVFDSVRRVCKCHGVLKCSHGMCANHAL